MTATCLRRTNRVHQSDSRNNAWDERQIKKFINKDSVQSLISMGEAWRRPSTDRVGQVKPQCKEQCRCRNLEVVNERTLSLKSCDVGDMGTHTRTEPRIEAAEWRSRVQVFEERLNCMVQQMIEASPGKKM